MEGASGAGPDGTGLSLGHGAWGEGKGSSSFLPTLALLLLHVPLLLPALPPWCWQGGLTRFWQAGVALVGVLMLTLSGKAKAMAKLKAEQDIDPASKSV